RPPLRPPDVLPRSPRPPDPPLFPYTTLFRSEEGDDVGVGHRHLVGALLVAGSEAFDVGLGQAVEIFSGDYQSVLVLGDVLFELHAQFDETGGQLSHFRSDIRAAFVAGAPKVAQRALE